MQKGRIERHVAKKYIVHIQDVQNQLIKKQKSIKIAETMGKLTDEHGQMTVYYISKPYTSHGHGNLKMAEFKLNICTDGIG